MAKIKISVNTTEFDRLLELGQQYVEMQSKSLALWNNINKRVNDIHRGTSLWAKTWGLIRKDWADLAAKVAGITAAIVSWKTALYTFKGLLGNGNLFGLSGLGATAAEGRRQSLSLGNNYGQMQSFMTNFQRLVDAQSMLANVSESKYNVASDARVGMIGLGLGGAEEAKKNPTEQLIDAMRATRRILKDVPEGDRLNVANARGIPNVISGQSINTIMNLDQKTFDQIIQMTKDNEERMNLSKEEQSSWALLIQKLDIAGRVVETAFQKRLMNLAAATGNVSSALTDRLLDIINGPGFKIIIDFITNGLKSFEQWLNGPTFKKDVEEFSSGVGNFLVNMGKIISGINKLFQIFSAFDKYDPTQMLFNSIISSASAGELPNGSSAPGGSGGSGSPSGAPSGMPPTSAEVQKLLDAGAPFPNTMAGHEAGYRFLGKKYGVNPDMLADLISSEGNNPTGWKRPNDLGSSVDVQNGQPFSFGDLQANIHKGVGVAMLKAGFDPRKNSEWFKNADWLVRYIIAKGNLEDWRTDRAYRKWGKGGWKTTPMTIPSHPHPTSKKETYDQIRDNLNQQMKGRSVGPFYGEPDPNWEDKAKSMNIPQANAGNQNHFQSRNNFAVNIFNKPGSSAVFDVQRLGA